MSSHSSEAVLIVGHGSRVSESNYQFESLVQRVQEGLPNRNLYFGYIELAQPFFGDQLEKIASENRFRKIKIIPYMLFMASHIKNDFPLEISKIKSKYPKLEISFSDPLGNDELLIQLLAKRILEIPKNNPNKTVLLMIGRGSSDPVANGDFFRASRLIGEYSGYKEVHSCFVGITEPNLPTTLENIGRMRPETLLIQPYFLFTGVLVERIEELVQSFSTKAPWVKIKLLPYIGNDKNLLPLLRNKINKETSKELASCLSCVYRPDPLAVQNKVDGLKALLWSLRHSFTHNQAMPHDHAHPPLLKHVLVCSNADCADKGSIRVLARLRQIIRTKKLTKEIKITKVSCLGRCGEGPTVVVYPDGIWYREFSDKECPSLVENHLLKDKLVTEKVDNIMS